MTRARRFIALFTFFAFVGLTAAEVSHSHQLTSSQSNCSMCKISHQTHAVDQKPDLPRPEMVISGIQQISIPRPYLQFVFESHGLSPPLAA